jgi:hypothetical protein
MAQIEDRASGSAAGEEPEDLTVPGWPGTCWTGEGRGRVAGSAGEGCGPGSPRRC